MFAATVIGIQLYIIIAVCKGVCFPNHRTNPIVPDSADLTHKAMCNSEFVLTVIS